MAEYRNKRGGLAKMKFNFLQKQTSRRDMLPGSATPAAWRTKPSWMLVAGSDRTINPDLERWYAKRAGSHTVEVAGASHSVYVSHQNEVSDLIESAARTVEM